MKNSEEYMINLAKNIKRIVSLKIASNNNENLILQKASLENATNILNSDTLSITNLNSLNDSIIQWKRKEGQIISLKRIVTVYMFAHIVDIIQLYAAVEKFKDEIQRMNPSYKQKKRNTKGWIKQYLADELGYSLRQLQRYITVAERLKSLYDNNGITSDILVLSKCYLSDFWCTSKTYQIFLHELEDISN